MQMRMDKLIAVVTFSMLLGNGAAVAADYDEGFRAFQKGLFPFALAHWVPLAEQGNVDAQNSLAALYKFGLGVPQEPKTAIKWYKLAAAQGDAAGQYGLGTMYDNGEGIPEDNETAVRWYTLSAEQGDEDAQLNLGVMYDSGQGVLENDETAVKWYGLAARQGLAEAQTNLGVMYQTGHGVPMDADRAYMWYNIAAYGGNDLGNRKKKLLASEMDASEKAKLQKMSNTCLASGYKDC
jgi:TPR repeat protein